MFKNIFYIFVSMSLLISWYSFDKEKEPMICINGSIYMDTGKAFNLNSPLLPMGNISSAVLNTFSLEISH